MPAAACETIVTFDAATGQITRDVIRRKEPPVGRSIASVLAAMSFFVAVSLVNIKYVDMISGKASAQSRKNAEKTRLYN